MKVFENQVFEDLTNKCFIRLLYVDKPNDIVIVISFDVDAVASKMPQPLSLAYFCQLIEIGKVVKLKKDPFLNMRSENEVSETDKKKRDKRFEALKDIVTLEPDIYNSQSRYSYIQSLIKDYSLPTINAWLKAFWVGGKVRNALLPKYLNSGGKGKRRSDPKRKLGRPNSLLSREGINIQDKDIEKIKKGFRRFYMKNPKNSKKQAYLNFIRHYYSKIDATGKRVVNWRSAPSFNQFCFWAKNSFTKEEILKARKGQIVYSKDVKLLTGRVTDGVKGPGYLFQIDASVLDIHIVSSLNRNQYIGKPTIYLVTDTFSRMIVGYTINLESPSYMAACLALLNTGIDKVECCAEYGINIKKEDWPSESMPYSLLGDNGELKGNMSDVINGNLGINIGNTASYRGDMKAVVERLFKTTQARISGHLSGKGGVNKDSNSRLENDSRKEAILTLEEVNKIIIAVILEYNNSHWIEDFAMTEELIKAGIKPIPRDIWNWGKEEGIGFYRHFEKEYLWYNLLPQKEVSFWKRWISRSILTP